MTVADSNGGARILLGVFVAAGAVAVFFLLYVVTLRIVDDLPDGSFAALFMLAWTGAAITASVTSLLVSRHVMAAFACGILLPPLVAQFMFLMGAALA